MILGDEGRRTGGAAASGAATDFTNTLTVWQLSDLGELLNAFEEKSGNQIVFFMVVNLVVNKVFLAPIFYRAPA